jgi:hypothetical protein
MKTLHITDKQTFLSYLPRMDEAQYLDLPNGKVLAACEIDDPNLASVWEANANVTSLPHPLDQTTVSVAIAANATALSSLLLLGLVTTDTTFTFFQKLQKIHPLFRP